MNEYLEKESRQSENISSWQAFLGFFGSMKTAVVLLLVVAAASAVGTFIEQKASAEAYGLGTYALLKALGLTNVHHSGWYNLLLSLVGLSLVVCSINRFGIAWRRTFSPRVAMKPEQMAKMQRSETFSYAGTPQEAMEKIGRFLRSRSYSVHSEADQSYILASKGRLSIWGPYLTHLSILVIFFGAIFGSWFGFHGFTNIIEGKETTSFHRFGDGDQKSDLGFKLALRRFTIEADSKHNATAYKSDVVVSDGGKIAAKKVIEVNQPLTYKGVSFFQSDFGLAGIIVQVTAPNGETAIIPFNVETRNSSDGKEYLISDQPYKTVSIGGKKITVFIHDFVPDYVGGDKVNAGFMPLNPAIQVLANDRLPEYRGLDAWERLGWIPESMGTNYKGFIISLADAVPYTGLEVSKNPCLPIIYAGFGLMLIGIFVSFYVTHKVLRVAVSPSGKSGVKVVLGATSRGGTEVFDRDFEKIREVLR